MALEKIRPRVVDATGNYTFNDVNLTGNVSSPTANIGNLTGVSNLVASSNTITVTGNLSTTANITAGNIKTNNLLYANGSPWAIGTTTTVSGSNTQVQFNDASSFGASANFTFDKTSNTLTVTNLNTNGSGITNITGSSVTGQVPNALIAATVYTNSQPNITSVGTLSSLTVTGTINSGNANLGNTATANYFVGSGNNLSNIQGSNITGAVSYATTANSVSGSNVSGAVTYAATANAVAGANVLGQVGNSVIAGTVYTNAQPNITSVGTLSSLVVTGDISSGNSNLGNTATANYFTGNGSLLSAINFANITTFSTAGLTTDELYLQSTTRLNVTASGASGYVFDQYGATVNPAIYVTSGQTLAFNLNVSGHPFLIQTSGSANYSIGLEHVSTTGTVLTTTSAQGQISGTLYWKVPYGITGNYKYQCSIHGGMNGNIVVTDANIANVTINLSTYATTANAVAGANVSGQVANALVASTVYTNAQPNITSVGILTELTVTGNTALSGANVSLGAVSNLKITGGTSGYVLQTDGSGTLSWVAQSGGSTSNISNGNSNVNISSANGDINFSAVGNANVVVITGTGANINGNLTVGNITGGNVVSANYFTGNLYGTANLATYATTANAVAGANVSGQVANALVASTVYTNAQPNITSTGTLTGLTVSGITTLGNIGNVKISGGSANFTLQTDGLGNLSWAVPPVTSVGDVTVDNFTGNGSQTAYTLSVTPGNIKYVTVNIDGVSQLRQAYTVSGTTLTFGGAPASGALIEVTILLPGQVAFATTASTVTASAQPNITSVGTLANLSIAGNITGNLLPSANITYDLGSPTQRWKDLYLSNSTIYLGDTPFSTANVFPFNLTIAPEVLAIQVSAPDAGDDTTWLWTWETSTLPYARSAITNSPQISVPMYKQGTYTLNNFAANETFGNMTQTHDGYFKWIDGAGTQNLVNWAVNNGNVNVTHPDINGGTSTSVERYTITVPSTVTPPTLNTPSANYAVSFVSMGAYTIGENQAAGIDHHDSAANGPNKNLGPLYRGGTYTFNLHSSIASHPFYLTTDNGSGFVANTYVGEYTTGVTGSRNNGTTGKTTLVFTVPSNAPDTLYYQCGVHSAMRGTITIKSLAVETNINGNYVIYFQHTGEGHKTPIEIRPIPSLVNQMCVVYDASVGKFVPQDMATYVENTPSFKNKIREVAGTATLVAGNDVVVVPSVSIVEDASYLPFVGNKNGDISYAEDSDTIYLWNGTQWRNTKAVSATPVYVNLNMPGSITAPFTGVARYYPINTILITTVYANLGTAPSGNFTFLIKKNGVSIGTTFTMSSVVMTPVSVNVSLTTSDYLTLDITGVNGSDLSIKLKYTY
jgi:plastocyanin